MSNMSDFLATKNAGEIIVTTESRGENFRKLVIVKKNKLFIECETISPESPRKYTFKLSNGCLKGEYYDIRKIHILELSPEQADKVTAEKKAALEFKQKSRELTDLIFEKLRYNTYTIEQLRTINQMLTPVENSLVLV